jgi:ribosomal protein L29
MSSSGITSGPARVCEEDCYAALSAFRIAFTVNPIRMGVIDVVEDARRTVHGTIHAPPGALQRTDNQIMSILHVRPVAHSRMRNAVNKIHSTRGGGYRTMAQTLLSTPFECLVDKSVKPVFSVPMTYTASIDLQLQPDYADVCLATLKTDAKMNFQWWECIYNSHSEREANPVRPKSFDGQPPRTVISNFDRCNVDGTIWAFIYSPRPYGQGNRDYTTWAQDNMMELIFGLLGGIAFVSLVFFSGSRLTRYRKKYHQERENVKKMEEEVTEMEQFGGQAGTLTKDEEVAMTANPLVRQMKDMQKRLDAKELAMRQAEQDARLAESEVRQLHINELASDRDDLAAELEALKQQLAAQQKGQRAPAMDIDTKSSGPTGPTGPQMMSTGTSRAAPVQSDFSVAPGQRKKKNF